MKVVYSDQEIPNGSSYNLAKTPSMFLCGPTPRSRDVKSWRPDALDILRKLNYEGIVLVPELSVFENSYHFLRQVEWEYTGLENCRLIVFWIPRNMTTLPGLTTNIEFGRYVACGHVLYGRPDDSENNSYIDWLYKKVTGKTPFNTLESLLEEAVKIQH